ncbi:MAG: isocitrate lyase/PEP mutase family protein [Deltaproteobacteria bacterium]
MKKTTQLRHLIEAPEILVSPGAYDCFSAKLIESMGFKAMATTGAGISESFLGVPDFGFLGLSENLMISRNIAQAVNLPVMADADTGYGNAVNVYHTVRMFEEAGITGINLEDQVAPKRCGHIKGKEIISMEEMVKKIEAAVAARKDPDFIINARTDAAAIAGIDEAIRRANAYHKAGADMVFPDAVLSEEDIAKFVGNVSAPVSINMGLAIRKRPTTPLVSIKRLEELGVARVTFPRMTTASALSGMKKALEVILESIAQGKIIERPDLCFSFEELSTLMGVPQMKELEERFLTEEALAGKYGRSR